jgi:DNA-binding transcriptional MerR regulator
MSNETLTHKDLAVLLGVSETTIKSYRKKFPGALPIVSRGKPIRFKAEAAEICFKIRDLFALGSSIDEIQSQLTAIFSWSKPKKQNVFIQKPQISAPANSPSAEDNPTAQFQNKINLSESFATALGNMAKSMITLNQSHADILAALKKIEGRLAVLELKMSALPLGIKNVLAETGARVELPDLLVNDFAPVDATALISSESPVLSEPEKHILYLPLLGRRKDGSYTTAGGERFSRLSLNDVIDLLGKAYPAPDNYTLRWEHDEYGTWAIFTRLDTGSAKIIHDMRFTIHEITSAKGVGVLEIRNYMDNKNSGPASFFFDFLRTLEK